MSSSEEACLQVARTQKPAAVKKLQKRTQKPASAKKPEQRNQKPASVEKPQKELPYSRYGRCAKHPQCMLGPIIMKTGDAKGRCRLYCRKFTYYKKLKYERCFYFQSVGSDRFHLLPIKMRQQLHELPAAFARGSKA